MTCILQHRKGGCYRDIGIRTTYQYKWRRELELSANKIGSLIRKFVLSESV